MADLGNSPLPPTLLYRHKLLFKLESKIMCVYTNATKRLNFLDLNSRQLEPLTVKENYTKKISESTKDLKK